MEVVHNIPDCRRSVAAARAASRPIVFVPTMGALHTGHLALVARARQHASAAAPFVVVSIFVNPTQFAPHEDFSRYPRDEAGDLARCRDAGVELAFLPHVDDMYPPETGGAAAATRIHVAGLSDGLCGPHRPGHFDGVATVVAKLFNIVQPDAACFGEKDYQQLAIIRRMVVDLNMPVTVIGCPTVREPDGLALSSRNRYLSPTERVQAAALIRGLQRGRALIAGGESSAERVVAAIRAEIAAAGPAEIDYISVADPETLAPVAPIDRAVQLALAVRIGRTRLIDNIRAEPPVLRTQR